MSRAVTALLLASTGCAAPAWKAAPHDVRFQRTPPPQLHVIPATRRPAEAWEAIRSSTVEPLARTINPGHYIDLLRGGRSALDINAFGQVVDSTWFENRIAKRELTPDELRRGPNRTDGPAAGPLDVLDGKFEGATPGLVIRDQEGRRFLVKFDPAAFPGLASGAEVITTKVLWAAGYHVPENHVGLLDLDKLRLRDRATTGAEYGRSVSFTKERLDDLLSHVNPFPDGTIRVLFSRFVPGSVLGPFSYRGQRTDDPNDNLPHERRRSLRALWLFSAWLNNVDTSEGNTIDAFITDEDSDLGFVRHYLIDFGDALGSAGVKPKYVASGFEGFIDWPYTLRSLVSLGIWYRPWLGVERSPYRSVGVFESQVFEPSAWRPGLPNPAFEEASWDDTYWAASLIARFTPEHLAALVDEAKYDEPNAREWVLRVLTERQFKILAWVFGRMLALDNPRADGTTLRLDDLEADVGLLLEESARYRWTARWNRSGGDDLPLGSGESADPIANLADAIVRARGTAGAAFESDPFISVTFQRLIPAHDGKVEVHSRVTADGILPVALERTTGG